MSIKLICKICDHDLSKAVIRNMSEDISLKEIMKLSICPDCKDLVRRDSLMKYQSEVNMLHVKKLIGSLPESEVPKKLKQSIYWLLSHSSNLSKAVIMRIPRSEEEYCKLCHKVTPLSNAVYKILEKNNITVSFCSGSDNQSYLMALNHVCWGYGAIKREIPFEKDMIESIDILKYKSHEVTLD